jgi:hypothetical protein
MAKKKRLYGAAASAVTKARAHHSSIGGTMGVVKPVAAGAIAQMIGSAANVFIKPWGGILALAGVGYVAKNETLLTVAGMHAGSQVPIAKMLGGGTTTASSGSGTNWI